MLHQAHLLPSPSMNSFLPGTGFCAPPTCFALLSDLNLKSRRLRGQNSLAFATGTACRLVAPISGQRPVGQPDPTAEHIEFGVRCLPEIGRAAQSSDARRVSLKRERSIGGLGVAVFIWHTHLRLLGTR